MKNAMYQIDLESANSFNKLANQALTINEMNHLFGGDNNENETDPPIYIKEE